MVCEGVPWFAHGLPLFRIQDFPNPLISHFWGCGGDGKHLMIIVYLDYCLLERVYSKVGTYKTRRHTYTHVGGALFMYHVSWWLAVRRSALLSD